MQAEDVSENVRLLAGGYQVRLTHKPTGCQSHGWSAVSVTAARMGAFARLSKVVAEFTQKESDDE